jgi:hypothetical protein
MRNPAPQPTRDAVLIELGEFRRVGNAYTIEDSEVVLTAFKAVFDPLFSASMTKTAFESVDRSGELDDAMFPPVGAPPITSREQQT